MVRSQNGHKLHHWSGSVAPEASSHSRVVTTWDTPENIVANQVRGHLCKAGPKKCAECKLCAFGRWWLEHNPEKREEKENA